LFNQVLEDVKNRERDGNKPEKEKLWGKRRRKISENSSSIDLSKAEMMIEGREDIIIFHITDF
jgi:hypothetical protein